MSGVERIVEREPVVVQLMLRIELERSVGMVRLVESQFVGELVVGQSIVFGR